MKTQNLSVEDRDMLLRLGNQSGMGAVTGMLDYDVRRSLCAEMAALGQGTKRLLTLLDRHGFIDGLADEAQLEYQSIMHEISAAALEGQVLFMRSRALDKDTLLAAMPEEGRIQ